MHKPKKKKTGQKLKLNLKLLLKLFPSGTFQNYLIPTILPADPDLSVDLRWKSVPLFFRARRSALGDAVVRRLGGRVQRFAGGFVFQRRAFGLVRHDGLPVVFQVGVVAARQLQQGGEAVQVGHLVEEAQQEVHHHQTQEEVDCREHRVHC